MGQSKDYITLAQSDITHAAAPRNNFALSIKTQKT